MKKRGHSIRGKGTNRGFQSEAFADPILDRLPEVKRDRDARRLIEIIEALPIAVGELERGKGER